MVLSEGKGLYIMHHSDVPASIIEIGYMSNKSDLKYILSKNGRKRLQKVFIKVLWRHWDEENYCCYLQ